MRRLGKRLFGQDGGVANLVRAIKNTNLEPITPRPLATATRLNLIKRFQADIEELEQITGRELSAWMTAS